MTSNSNNTTTSNTSNSNTNKSHSSQSQTKISELRVAQTELLICGKNKTGGKVFSRLSEGAVAFRVTRSEAEADVSSRLRRELLKEYKE